MHNPDADAPLFNALPPAVAIMAVLIGTIELAFVLGSSGLIGGPTAIGWRGVMAENFGFFNAVAQWMVETGQYPVRQVIRFVSYLFFHTDTTSAVFSVVFLLALGKWVGERLPVSSFLVIFFGSGIAAAVGFTFAFGPNNLLMGTSSANFGLIGALTWMLFSTARANGQNGRNAFGLIGGLAAIYAIFFVIFGGIEWFDRLVGFGFGFVATAVLHPFPGADLRYWLRKMRQR